MKQNTCRRQLTRSQGMSTQLWRRNRIGTCWTLMPGAKAPFRTIQHQMPRKTKRIKKPPPAIEGKIYKQTVTTMQQEELLGHCNLGVFYNRIGWGSRWSTTVGDRAHWPIGLINYLKLCCNLWYPLYLPLTSFIDTIIVVDHNIVLTTLVFFSVDLTIITLLFICFYRRALFCSSSFGGGNGGEITRSLRANVWVYDKQTKCTIATTHQPTNHPTSPPILLAC